MKQLSFFESTEAGEKDEQENWHKLSLEFIPTSLIGLYDNKIVYCNQYAVNFFSASIKNNLLSKDVSDFILPEFKDEFFQFILSISKSAKTCEKITLKLRNFADEIMEAELQHIFTSIDDQISLVLIQRKTNDKRKELIQQTNLKILQAANSFFPLEELCDYLYKIITDIIPVKNFYVALYDKSKRILSFPYYRDEFNAKPQERKFGNGLTEYVITTRSTLFLNKEKVKEFIKKGYIASLEVPVIGWMGVPLKIQEEISGAIVVKEYYNENVLTDDAKEILELVSFPVSRAIERAIIEEERKIYLEKLQDLNKAKDKFFSIISHDLKSPFNSILGFTEILKEQDGFLENKEREQIFNSLYNSTRNIYNLLNNLLQYSRFQAGLVEFEQVSLNLWDAANENIEILKGNAFKKQIKIQCLINKDLIVLCDKEMLNSVFRNLINNAIKFTKEGGEIVMETKVENGYANIFIKDNGIGMDEKSLANLFKPDLKKSTPGTNMEEGTGLGLILVKEFIEKNEGQISVKSKPGKGSEFVFSLKLFQS
jgi:signal transduction histidine kinase